MTSGEKENQTIAETMRAHHARMVANLGAQVARLEQADGEGSWQAARDALAAHVRREIVPHAKAEETTIYQAARRDPSLTRLIAAMVLEHGHILNLTDDLEGAPSALAALRCGGGLEALFAAHADTENRVILTALEADPSIGLRDILGEMHHELDAAAASRPADPADPPQADAKAIALDVREVPHAQRHALIFGLVSHLNEHQRLVLTVDHDPLPLRYQLAARYGDRLGWTYDAEGPREWQVVVTLGA